MEIKEAIEILRKHNEWRRYDGEPGKGPEMTEPKTLGIAIEVVIQHFERAKEWDKEEWSKEDELMRNACIAFIQDEKFKGYERSYECVDWLKSLRWRSVQKPDTAGGFAASFKYYTAFLSALRAFIDEFQKRMVETK